MYVFFYGPCINTQEKNDDNIQPFWPNKSKGFIYCIASENISFGTKRELPSIHSEHFVPNQKAGLGS